MRNIYDLWIGRKIAWENGFAAASGQVDEGVGGTKKSEAWRASL